MGLLTDFYRFSIGYFPNFVQRFILFECRFVSKSSILTGILPNQVFVHAILRKFENPDFCGSTEAVGGLRAHFLKLKWAETHAKYP